MIIGLAVLCITINYIFPNCLLITSIQTFYDHRFEVLSGISGSALLITSLNAFVEGVNRSILVGLFGKKPLAAKDDKSCALADRSRFAHIEENIN